MICHCLLSKSIAGFLTVISAKSAANDNQKRSAWFMVTPVLDLIVRIARVRWAGLYFSHGKAPLLCPRRSTQDGHHSDSVVTEEFKPNDFEMRRPDSLSARRLRRAIEKMRAFAHVILTNPAFSVDAPWNDVAHRSGLVPRE
jgi:hypothetical protein